MSVKIAECHCQKMCYIPVAVKIVAEFSSFTAKDATSLPSLVQKCAHLFVFLIDQMSYSLAYPFGWFSRACVSAYHARTLQGFCIAILGQKNVGDKTKNVGEFLENVHRFSEKVQRF